MWIKIKVLNKHLAFITYGSGSPQFIANPFELAKQQVIYEKTKSNLPLPRFGLDLYYLEEDYPDLIHWWNNAGVLPMEVLETVDFSKPYDDNLINQYWKPKQQKQIAINADDLINAELSE
jgi:hypothetical protein